MRRYLLAAVAAAVIATPAMARDNSPYIGLDAGFTIPTSKDVNGSAVFTNPTILPLGAAPIGKMKFKWGEDFDLNAGYDFGMFRLEGEVGYKHSKVRRFDFNTGYLTAINGGSGNSFVSGNDLGFNRGVSVWDAMLNGLVDFGSDRGLSGFVGAGIGYAHVHELGKSQSKPAGQLLAGVRMAVSDNVDVGLKYRYFRSLGRMNFYDNAAFSGVGTGSGGIASINSSQHFSSHSLLLSLTYNFAAAEAPPPPPPPAPPPPPPPPATQTCPDGSVIDATATCPAPPPPPPPPPPAQRGERGQ